MSEKHFRHGLHNLTFDFLNQGGQVGLFEADTRCWYPVKPKIRKNVFMMRISTGQFGDVWMFKWVIPGDFLASLIDFIAIVTNLSGLKVNKLPHIQDHIALENYLPFEFGQRGTDGSQNQCGASDARITLLKRVDEFSVGMEIRYGHYVAEAVGFSGLRCKAPSPDLWRNLRR